MYYNTNDINFGEIFKRADKVLTSAYDTTNSPLHFTCPISNRRMKMTSPRVQKPQFDFNKSILTLD